MGLAGRLLMAAAAAAAAAVCVLVSTPAQAADIVGQFRSDPGTDASEASSRWLRSLYGAPTVTHGDVLLGVALIDDAKRWKRRYRYAARHAWRRGYVAVTPDELTVEADRGFACRVFARMLRIRGGLLMRLTHEHPRYAYRELVALGLVPAGGDRVLLTGDELAGLLLGAARYREVGPEAQPGGGEV
jgi:hypothetical protein